MNAIGRARLAAAGAFVLAAGGLWLALAPALASAPDVAPAARSGGPPALRTTSELPAWLAPGVRARVAGWADAHEPVQLRSGSTVLARARAGRLGRFELSFRAPARAGRYRLGLWTPTRTLPLAPLVVRPVVLAAGGDVNLGDRIGEAIGAGGADAPWRHVAPLLRAADLAVVNLECAVSDRGYPVAGKEYVFRGPAGALAGAARAGVDAVSVANNHSLDFGAEAFLDTLARARRAGIQPFGGGADLAASRRPALFERGGLRIALLAYSDVRPLGFDSAPGKAGAARADVGWIAEDVARARARADVVAVYFHWGVELARQPDARQRTFADAALRAGAAVVLGAHPHVLQPLERRDRKLVAWSLGNFVFGAASPGTTETGVLLVDLAADGVRGATLVPARIEGFTPVLDPARGRTALRRLTSWQA